MDIMTKKKNILKLISILLAVLLWLYVINQSDEASYNNVIKSQIEYINVPDDVSVEGPTTVGIKIWGTQKQSEDIVAYVDLAGLEEGIHQVKVKVNPIEGALLTRVEPDKIEIKIGSQKKKSIKIQPEIKGNLPEGYSLLDLLIVPTECLVQGEEEQIQKIVSVVAPLDLLLTENISEHNVKLQARDEAGRIINEGINLLPETVQIFTVVEADRITKKVDVEVDLKDMPAAGLKVKQVVLEPQQVTIVGKKQIVDSLSMVKTMPINLGELKESLTTWLEIQVPEDTVVFPTKGEVNIEIEKIENEEG
jgi:YbbR domain-containing protein